jgi:hypothetical protein
LLRLAPYSTLDREPLGAGQGIVNGDGRAANRRRWGQA